MFIVSNDFYNEIDLIAENIKLLEFKDEPNGLVVPEFNMVSPSHSESLGALLNKEVNIIDELCLFKRPNELVQFEWYREGIDLMALIAFEDLEIKFWKYNKTGNPHYGGIEDFEEYFKVYSWDNYTMTNSVKLCKNDLIVMDPHVFKSIECSPLIQTLFFEIKQ